MSKAIYVLDGMPDNCAKCPIVCDEAPSPIERPEGLEGCPLKEMPERAKIDEFWDDDSAGYVAGWNACLDKIGGEEE